MNKAVITVYEENNAIENSSGDSELEEPSSDQISNNTIKAKTFTIKIDLSDT